MTPEEPIDDRPIRSITPDEYRFLSRIGQETGIDLKFYGLTEDVLVKSISSAWRGITFDLNDMEYHRQWDNYNLVEGKFCDTRGHDVEFVVSLDARGNLYQLDIFSDRTGDAIPYPLDSDPIVIRYPIGEVQLAVVQSIPWLNPTLPRPAFETRKIRQDEFDFLRRLARESGVDLFSLGLADDLLVHPISNKSSIALLVDDRPYWTSMGRFVIAGTFHDSDGMHSSFSVSVNKREKLQFLFIRRPDHRPLKHLPQASDPLEFQQPKPLGNPS